MVEQLIIQEQDDCFYVPDANQLVTEDDTLLDNFASEKQQHLLVGSSYSSLQNKTFIACGTGIPACPMVRGGQGCHWRQVKLKLITSISIYA